MKTYLLETTSESLAPVKLAFRLVMENRIPQRMRNCLAGLYRELAPDMTFQEVARIRSFVADESSAATAQGLDDLADSLDKVFSELSTVLDGMDYYTDSEG
jgi:hypothetical protein